MSQMAAGDGFADIIGRYWVPQCMGRVSCNENDDTLLHWQAVRDCQMALCTQQEHRGVCWIRRSRVRSERGLVGPYELHRCLHSACGFTTFRSAYAHTFAGVLSINVVDKLPALLGISMFSAAVELVPGGEKQVLTHITPFFVANYPFFPSIF
jgi:hypothetical protein